MFEKKMTGPERGQHDLNLLGADLRCAWIWMRKHPRKPIQKRRIELKRKPEAWGID
jgi:hypothetical protein